MTVRAMLLAAGLGTRLSPLTDELPKPLVPVGNRTMLARVAERIAAAGIDEAVMNTHHLAEAFTAQRIAELPFRVAVVHEPDILGTAGGVANAAALLGEGDVLVHSADILADLDVAALIDAHARGGALATLAVSPRDAGQGTVGLDARDRIVRIRGERFGLEARGGDFVAVQVIGSGLRRLLPPLGCLVGDVYVPALRQGAVLRAFVFDGAWTDIGTPAAYLEANLGALPGVPERIDASAIVAREVEVRDSFVGARARVSGRGVVRSSVVWPEAHASAPLERAIVTTRGLVLRVP